MVRLLMAYIKHIMYVASLNEQLTVSVKTVYKLSLRGLIHHKQQNCLQASNTSAVDSFVDYYGSVLGLSRRSFPV